MTTDKQQMQEEKHEKYEEKHGKKHAKRLKGEPRMRGIEAAVLICDRMSKGANVSEELRRLGEKLAPSDLSLAGTLAYCVARRLSLWEELRRCFLLPKPSKFSSAVQLAVLVGIAGLAELKHFAPAALVSGLVDWTKIRDTRGSSVVNAVLRRAIRELPAAMLQIETDKSFASYCLACGAPLWIGQVWKRQYGATVSQRLIASCGEKALLTLRLSPGDHAVTRQLIEQGVQTEPSSVNNALRLDRTYLPSALPGYAEGFVTPQSESSQIVGNEAAQQFEGMYFLDMCAGRGVKTGQIAQLRPEVTIEAWDLSEGRVAAGKEEMKRLGTDGRVTYFVGDALILQPHGVPDAVLLDVPCSGSGTWRRHPEGKWRLTPEGLEELCLLQFQLLKRACALLSSNGGHGGKIVYSTCSVLACENEDVVSRVLAEIPVAAEVPPKCVPKMLSSRRSHGHLILPDNPWTDGFYFALLEVKPAHV